MAKEEKLYEKVEDAEKIVKELCEKYPEVLWRVRPTKIAVMGISNKDRSKKSKTLIKVSPVKGVNKAINTLYNIPISNVIELYWNDWNQWTLTFKEWIIMKALLSIGEEDGKVIKADCTDYRIILDIVGVDWEKKDNLPSLSDTVIPFKKELRPGLDEEDSDNEPTEGTEED